MTADGRRVVDRWHGWDWLAVGIASPAFFVGTHAAFLTQPRRFVVAVAFCMVGLLLWIAETRRGVNGQEASRVDRPVTMTYIALMFVASSITIPSNPTGPPAWFVVVSVLPAVPCLMAAWRMLR